MVSENEQKQESVLTILDDDKPSSGGSGRFGGRLSLSIIASQIVMSFLMALVVVMVMTPSQSSFSELDTKINSDFAALSSSIDSKISTLNTNLDQQFSGFQGTINSQVATIDGKVAAFDARVSGLSGLDAKVTALAGLDSRVAAAENKIDSVIIDIDSKMDVSISVRLTEIENRLDALEKTDAYILKILAGM